jgi:hypothetical protein
VAQQYTLRTKKANALVFRQLKIIYGQKPGDDAVEILSYPKDVMLRLAKANPKSASQRKLDAEAVMQQPRGETKFDITDELDDDIVLPGLHKNALRDKNEILANVGPVYANKIGSILATLRVWKRFRDSLGEGTKERYMSSSEGFLPALEHNAEVSARKTTSANYAIPNYELLLKFLPKVKEKSGAKSPAYLACLLQVKLLGLRDDLGGVEILSSDGDESVKRN